jgi:hypothetical protein
MQKLQRKSWKKLAQKQTSSNFGLPALVDGNFNSARVKARTRRNGWFGFGSFVVFKF